MKTTFKVSYYLRSNYENKTAEALSVTAEEHPCEQEQEQGGDVETIAPLADDYARKDEHCTKEKMFSGVNVMLLMFHHFILGVVPLLRVTTTENNIDNKRTPKITARLTGVETSM